MDSPTRRQLLKTAAFGGIALAARPLFALAQRPSNRPAPSSRRFTSAAVEEAIAKAKSQIADPETAWLFENCYPNTLDTTVTYQTLDGKPDTFVITGDIDAMWLRDSSAQVWPYLPLAKKDPQLKRLLEGVIRRQSRCILIDPYANAFYPNATQTSDWKSDFTVMKPGVHEHKWEIDSLCYPIRLAHGYWQQTGDTAPFDSEWEAAMDAIVKTFKDQQRKDSSGGYYFSRGESKVTMDTPEIYGSPVKPIGLICSRFRPSDDPTTYQFLIPSNYFAVASLRQMATMLDKIRHQPQKAANARALADEVDHVLKQVARQKHPKYGTVFVYELDGLGHSSLMDDSNVPDLLSLPYLDACKTTDRVYQNTRKFIWSPDNPWFFQGKYTGVGGPHVGQDYIWPMSLIMFALTSNDPKEIAYSLEALKETHAGTGFMHESFHKDDPTKFTRSWFAWANTLYGELILHTLAHHPQLLKTT